MISINSRRANLALYFQSHQLKFKSNPDFANQRVHPFRFDGQKRSRCVLNLDYLDTTLFKTSFIRVEVKICLFKNSERRGRALNLYIFLSVLSGTERVGL